MARARAGAHHRVAGLDVTQRFSFEVETVDEHAVDAQICGEHETVGWIGNDAVGMRRLLTLSIRSAASVVHHVSRWRERSVGLDREQRDAATVVVGDEHHSAATVNAHEARRSTARLLRVESSELPGVARDPEGAHGTGRLAVVLVDFIYSVENAAVRVDGEERWVRAGVHRADSP